MLVTKGSIYFISAWSDKVKGHIFFSHLNALTEEDKSWHQFNRNVLVLCHDLISSHPSPLVIPGSPRHATTASGDNSWGYGLTGGSPCTAALRERCTCSGPGCSVAFMREPRLRALLFLECRRGLARATVQWNGKHAIPCSAWCRVTVRGCVMFLGYWLNDLGLHDKSLNPCRLSACWQRNVSSTCLHIDLRTLLDWRVHIPKVSPPGPRNNLSTTLPVFHALLAVGLAAIETFHWTCVFFYWYSYGLPVCGSSPIQLPLHGWHGWEFSRMWGILFTVTVGWKVKAQRKHRPLAGAEMTAQRARPSWLPLPSGPSRRQNHHMPFICWKNYDILTCHTSNKLCIPLYIVCKRIILHIWLMPCLVMWF